MPLYEAHCRPIGRPDLTASLVFLLVGTDYRAAWRAAKQRCFDGGRVEVRDGGERWIDPRRWTVCRVRPAADAVEESEAEEGADDWPRPDPAFASAATREAAMGKAYAGRRYESLPIRRSPKVLSFAGNSRPVSLRLL